MNKSIEVVVWTEKQMRLDRAVFCLEFVLDDEDELVSDEERTCLNCRYRRWTVDSFECMKESL